MAASADNPQAVRIATLNTWDMRGNWPGRRRVLGDGLLALDADLLTLQETIVDNGYDQVADVLDSRYEIIHQQDRESDGQRISTASRWPVGEIIELDINVTIRTGDFAWASIITEILAPPPLERIWLVNNLPDWQLDHEHERELQAVRTATAAEELVARKPGHVIDAGDFDADPAAASIRFWTRRQSLNGHSVCYHDAWETARPGEPGHTFVPDNPQRRLGLALPPDRLHPDPLRPARRPHPHGQQLQADLRPPANAISDHYGLVADLALPPRSPKTCSRPSTCEE